MRQFPNELLLSKDRFDRGVDIDSRLQPDRSVAASARASDPPPTFPSRGGQTARPAALTARLPDGTRGSRPIRRPSTVSRRACPWTNRLGSGRFTSWPCGCHCQPHARLAPNATRLTFWVNISRLLYSSSHATYNNSEAR